MDPVTLIVAAVGAGLTVIGQAAVSEAAKDAYDSLKSMLVAHFHHKPEQEAALASFESDPEHAPQGLIAAVNESGASQDPAVVAAARKLLAAADPDGAIARKYAVQIQGGVQGQVIGDNNTVNMTFGPPEPKT